MNQQQAIQFLPFVINQDIRLQVHSFWEINGIWKHTNKCPRCCAFILLGYPLDKEIAIE